MPAIETRVLDRTRLCETGMQLAARFLNSCAKGLETLDMPSSPPEFLVRWTELLEHRSGCPNCGKV